MPVDTSIYQNIQSVQVPDQLNRLAAFGQIQQQQNVNKLAQYQLDRAAQEDAQRIGMNKAIADATDPTTGAVNYGKAQANLAAGGFGSAIPGLTKSAAEAQKAQREQEAAAFDLAHKRTTSFLNIVGSAKDQASYDTAKQNAAAMGIDISTAPAQFDPAYVASLGQQALTAQQRVENAAKERGLDLTAAAQAETARHNRAGEANAAGQLEVQKGQLGVAQAGVRIKEKELEAGKVPQGYRRAADGSGNLEAIPGGPADIKNSKEGNQRTQDAKDVLSIAQEAQKLLPNASNGYLSQGANVAAGALGISTQAAQTDARLKVLQGALVSKMPKMSGPQSDKDVLLYREMAGQIGDPTVPIKQRQAALDTVISLQNKYLGQDSSPASASPGGGKPSLNDIFGQ